MTMLHHILVKFTPDAGDHAVLESRIRALFADAPATIIAVSHDALFARAVCTRALRLTKDGLREADFDSL